MGHHFYTHCKKVHNRIFYDETINLWILDFSLYLCMMTLLHDKFYDSRSTGITAYVMIPLRVSIYEVCSKSNTNFEFSRVMYIGISIFLCYVGTYVSHVCWQIVICLKKTKNDVPRMNSVGINKLKNNIQYKIKLLKCLSFSHKFRT